MYVLGCTCTKQKHTGPACFSISSNTSLDIMSGFLARLKVKVQRSAIVRPASNQGSKLVKHQPINI